MKPGFPTCLLAAGAAAVLAVARLAAADPAPAPDADPAFHQLDFWLGRWEVFDAATGRLDGHDRIAKILRGCAVTEDWTEADGSAEGHSLFHYNPATRTWRQTWVTSAGTSKEKQMIAPPAPGAVRFQGEVPLRDGGSVLDRTTLAALPDGRVRQTIEISRDHGQSWQLRYDAFYVRMPEAGN